MQIAGLVKNSFVDYPGHIAAAVFVPGCNMDCWYCHNRALWERGELLDEEEVAAFLMKRRGFLDGVVVSGGEPSLQSDLPLFVRRLKDMGYLVKLDTNGLLAGGRGGDAAADRLYRARFKGAARRTG